MRKTGLEKELVKPLNAAVALLPCVTPPQARDIRPCDGWQSDARAIAELVAA